jgi:hypothetical protein
MLNGCVITTTDTNYSWTAPAVSWVGMGLRQLYLLLSGLFVGGLFRVGPVRRRQIRHWLEANTLLLCSLCYLLCVLILTTWLPATHILPDLRLMTHRSITHYVWLWEVKGDSIQVQTIVFKQFALL